MRYATLVVALGWLAVGAAVGQAAPGAPDAPTRVAIAPVLRVDSSIGEFWPERLARDIERGFGKVTDLTIVSARTVERELVGLGERDVLRLDAAGWDRLYRRLKAQVLLRTTYQEDRSGVMVRAEWRSLWTRDFLGSATVNGADAQEVLDRIPSLVQMLWRCFPAEGWIVERLPSGRLLVNVGRRQGLSVGELLEVFEVWGMESDEIPAGTLRVTRLFEDEAEATPRPGGSFQPGMGVRRPRERSDFSPYRPGPYRPLFFERIVCPPLFRPGGSLSLELDLCAPGSVRVSALFPGGPVILLETSAATGRLAVEWTPPLGLDTCVLQCLAWDAGGLREARYLPLQAAYRRLGHRYDSCPCFSVQVRPGGLGGAISLVYTSDIPATVELWRVLPTGARLPVRPAHRVIPDARYHAVVAPSMGGGSLLIRAVDEDGFTWEWPMPLG